MLENYMVMDFENSNKKNLKCSICENKFCEYGYEIEDKIICPECMEEMKIFIEE